MLELSPSTRAPVIVDAAHSNASLLRRQSRADQQRLRALATVIEMLSALDVCDGLEPACAEATRSLREILAADEVMILWRRAGCADLCLPTPGKMEMASDRLRSALAAGEEIANRGAATIWPAAANDRHALLAVKQFVESSDIQALCGVQLPNQSGGDCGALIVLNPSNEVECDVENFLSAIAMPLAGKLRSFERVQPTLPEKVFRRAIRVFQESTCTWVAIALTLLVLILLLPMPYQIGAKLEIQPMQRRFVAVPFDGPLQSAEVRPGDMVQAGDVVARIDPREINYELASVRAKLNQSLQDKKGKLAAHDFAASKIASLESERLQLETDLLKHRHDNLEIRSPIDGVVVSGDFRESEGMPMSRGDTLFEIAPLEKMVVEIAVPEIDIEYARERMEVEFYVDALPAQAVKGHLQRIHPRAELRDHENVFIAELVIANPDNRFRPGMRGRAKITGDRKPLGWSLFHKAYFACRKSLWW